MPVVTLKPGHVQPVWAGHPWVYPQAIERIEGGPAAGDEVSVVDPRGNFLGRGFWSPRSSIAVRLVVRDPKTRIDAAFFADRVDRAAARRRAMGLPSPDTDALRLVHAEGDDLPGLVVDVFGDVAVVQMTTAGMKVREAMVLDAVERVTGARAVVDRTPPGPARMEGYEPRSGVVRGDASADALRFVERGLRWELPLSIGQKTGFYLDQRPLRARVEDLSRGRRVLDAYSFVGAVALAAARGGASETVAVDESPIVLEVGAECARRNGLGDRVSFVRADARAYLREAGARGGFDLVVCDPPKLAPGRGARAGALVAYQKIAAAACAATRPGGLIVLCSCSAAVGQDALVRALALGAREANARAIVLERFFQGADHPVPAAFPEGLYLASVLARVESVVG